LYERHSELDDQLDDLQPCADISSQFSRDVLLQRHAYAVGDLLLRLLCHANSSSTRPEEGIYNDQCDAVFHPFGSVAGSSDELEHLN
jgi:hypothetical protein